MLSVETNETKKGLGIHARRALAYIVLVIMSFLCLCLLEFERLHLHAE